MKPHFECLLRPCTAVVDDRRKHLACHHRVESVTFSKQPDDSLYVLFSQVDMRS